MLAQVEAAFNSFPVDGSRMVRALQDVDGL
jgi:hypothetical protein